MMRALGPATKGLALGSLVLAVASESWLARPTWTLLPHAVALAGLAGVIGGRFAPWHTAAAILSVIYLSPVAAVLFLGRFYVELLLVWSAGMAGLLVGDPDRLRWAYPSRWRFALILWALTVAVVWPITALREADFESLTLLQRYNIPNTGIGGSPRMIIGWALDTTIVHLLGLLWFNWLLRHATDLTPPIVERRIAWPMAASAVAGSLLAAYQGLFDLRFLFAGIWASMQRASGSLMDANASGMVAAMWTAGLLAFERRSWGARAITAACVVVCWCGLWTSGSRTSLACACVALAFWAASFLTRAGGARLRVAVLTMGAAAVVLVASVLILAPVASESPLSRLRTTLPSDFSGASLAAFVREMWNRNGYGEAATALIAEHPATGLGIGLFNLSGAAHSRAAGGALPPDNAQNWWRHHIAELGFMGAAGLLIWTALFLAFLARSGGVGPRRARAAALKGALVGFGLTSLVGMPAQSLPVTMTFWTFVFWYTRLVTESAHESPDGELSAPLWVLLLGLVGVYASTVLVEARGSARPAMRAAVGEWRYTYGVYAPRVSGPDGETRRWTERHGVAVVPNETGWMILTVRAEHPDLRDRPVRATVDVNGERVIDMRLHNRASVIRALNTGSASRVILEARVDRTWRLPDAAPGQPEVGLSLSWRFASAPPDGLRTITAPLRQ
jgi:hypothetical protein